MQDAAGTSFPVIVVGAGAAGLVAAIFASRGSRGVLLLERTREGGKKILISGGGRCNLLPAAFRPERFVTDSSPHTLRRLLGAWPLEEQRRFFQEEAGIPLILEPSTEKLFPVSGRARQVRDRLLHLASSRGVELRFESTVTGLDLPGENGEWTLRLTSGAFLRTPAAVFATGGLSVPSTGSDGTGLEILRRLGVEIHPTYPALTPLLADPARHGALAGISLNVTISSPGGRHRAVSRGGFLFTHRGYSGPAVLNLSHLAARTRLPGSARPSFLVQWTDREADAWEELLREERVRAGSLLRLHLPERLARTLLSEAGVEPERSLSQLRREERRRLVDLLTRYPLPWEGTEGYRKAEVTGGGVALEELDPRTLECRRAPGLFLCGEMLDAFGPIGGHNFAWAFATGRAAGLGASEVASRGGNRLRESDEC
jgi:predicted Rossmann fold flavoprotein